MSADDAATSFDAAFRAHVRVVRAYTLRRTAPEDAADIVAETFAVAWRRWDDAPADPLPWLLGIARRVVANARRTSSRASRAAARVAAEPREWAPTPPGRPPGGGGGGAGGAGGPGGGPRGRGRPLPGPRPARPALPRLLPSTVRR